MNLSLIATKKQSKIVLGVELGAQSFAYALVQTGKVNHVLFAKEEEVPTEVVGNFSLLTEYIKKCLATCPYHFDGLAVADSQVEYKSLPLKNVGDREIKSILQHEMQISWGLNAEDYLCSWYRKEAKDADLQIGLIKHQQLQNYLELTKVLNTQLLAVTGVQPIQFSDALVYNPGYKDDKEKENLESNFCGAIHAVLVAVQSDKDVNFLQQLQAASQRSKYAANYLFGSKLVGLFTILALSGAGLFYGISCYKLYVAQKSLAAQQQWVERYDYCSQMGMKINRLQSEVNGVKVAYPFRGELVEKILDAMPDYNNEITRLRMEEGRGDKQKGRIVLEGRVQDSKQLRSFLNALQKIEDFGKVDLSGSKNGADNSLDYSISLQYGNKR